MACWLVKSEPSVYSWDKMANEGVTHWNGVHNYQASNNMKAMKVGEECFFYHSNEGKEIIGIVKVAKEYYPDPADKEGRFGMVDVKAVKSLPKPVTLKHIKDEKELKSMALVRQSRLSVCPVTEAEWTLICKMGGL